MPGGLFHDEVGQETSIILSSGVVAKVTKQISEPLVDSLPVLGFEMVEFPSKYKILEFAVVPNGASQKVAGFKNDGAMERHVTNDNVLYHS